MIRSNTLTKGRYTLMNEPFPGRILVIGLGSVSRCTLPLLFRHVLAKPTQYTVLDFGDVADDAKWVQEQGARFVKGRVEQHDFGSLLSQYVGDGDVIIDLAWNIGTIDILQWCREHGVRYVN